MRVVVADDSLQARLRLSRQVREMGHKVEAECSGLDEVVRACAEHSPDAVLIDIVMPPSKEYKNGFQAVNAIQTTTTTKHIVAVTALARKADLDALLKAGIHVLRKPVSKENLRSTLEELRNAER